jgi:hypothetical protein
MPAKRDLVGEIFGRLTIIEDTGERCGGNVLWLGKCSCRPNKFTKVSSSNLRSGHTKSCGCLALESTIAKGHANRKHGATSTKIEGSQLDYNIWHGIKQRCYTKTNPAYPGYGGRGIKMHKLWRKDFIEFAAYIRTLPDCPDEKILSSRSGGRRIPRTLDRIKNNGNYEPGNVKWSTSKEQANNTRKNKIVKFKGEKLTLAQAVDKYAIVCRNTVDSRLRMGWSLKEALLTPVR